MFWLPDSTYCPKMPKNERKRLRTKNKHNAMEQDDNMMCIYKTTRNNIKMERVYICG